MAAGYVTNCLQNRNPCQFFISECVIFPCRICLFCLLLLESCFIGFFSAFSIPLCLSVCVPGLAWTMAAKEFLASSALSFPVIVEHLSRGNAPDLLLSSLTCCLCHVFSDNLNHLAITGRHSTPPFLCWQNICSACSEPLQD